MLLQANTFHAGYKHAATYSNVTHKGTPKYDVLQTGAVIEMIKANSPYDVVTYHEGKTRKASRSGQQVHLVRMRDTRLSTELVTHNGLVPEIVWSYPTPRHQVIKSTTLISKSMGPTVQRVTGNVMLATRPGV